MDTKLEVPVIVACASRKVESKETMAKTRLSRDDGMRHLPGSSLCMFETLCGACDSNDEYTDSDELPNCDGCLSTAALVFKSITKRELARSEAIRPTYRKREHY